MTDHTREEIEALAERISRHLEAGGRLFDFSLVDGQAIIRALHHYAEALDAKPVALRFPTMLRKMWSGGEVQAWLDGQPPLYAAPPVRPVVAEDPV